MATPLAAFTVADLDTNRHQLRVDGDFTLGADSTGIDLVHQSLTLTAGAFSITIPRGNFTQVGRQNHFIFHGAINGLKMDADVKAVHGNATNFRYSVQAKDVDLTLPNPVRVTLRIGQNSGTASVAH